MSSIRSTSIVVGCLFLTATVGYVAGQVIYTPLIEAPDPLATVHLHRSRLLAGVFVELAGILAIPLIAAFCFPILRRFGDGLALSYIALRAIEALLLVMVVVNVLSIADASRAYLEGEGAANPDWVSLAASLELVRTWPFLLSVGVVFPLGALLLNWCLYRGRLVPRLIAAWGFLGGAILLLGSVMDMLGAFSGISPVALEVTVSGPIAIQEMVLAVWLIARGFDVRVAADVELAMP